MLAARSDGVAKASLHTFGKAIDIRLPGRKLSGLRTAALSLQMGGVGYLPPISSIWIRGTYVSGVVNINLSHVRTIES